ncbi:nitrate reductase molybdenum cofactor assembly chaperone [Streptomyces pluripotens]|uniref:Nitrate reductase molybdenum cofactor assembly chaperone n=1 Tax=Streptomyces pluripotens TaxID=1355015 RepID=A0A221P5S0_9ACTN|nr:MULTISPECIES: nitrate reductase molybdenum cofactor assembly chaperone [Streptomyces]ARP73187.1 nitrate reductase molybdenum cofactor assembly chaperone [Streptomyces pluripotens]ASN27436.1 nitrate reductase molybdenum cofactor assembly chaperone [Streptomyces pluripotens]KIE28596.1 nitrate reductase [Streptomyces sp. MUSC 125]MCH0558035.1 nitrate reductase molybdenum cofactor assembly chaperone [Streptomyces sp. MUM 16J]
MPSDAVLYQAAALCLTYPDDDLIARLPLLREAAPQLRTFTDYAAITSSQDLAAHYVEVFRAGNRHSLYLSRWYEGDLRRRHLLLVHIEDVYREHGLECSRDELPDFLPAVLELTSRTGDTRLLTEYRGALEGLRARLTGYGTPYACVLDAVSAILPTVCSRPRP